MLLNTEAYDTSLPNLKTTLKFYIKTKCSTFNENVDTVDRQFQNSLSQKIFCETVPNGDKFTVKFPKVSVNYEITLQHITL